MTPESLYSMTLQASQCKSLRACLLSLRTLALTFSLLLLPELLFAQWVKTNGPYGGYIYCLTGRGDTIFAGTDNRIFRSFDGGDLWSAADSGFSCERVEGLGFSGMDVWAGAIGAVYRSSDLGRSWKHLSGLPENAHFLDFLFRDSVVLTAASGYSDGHVTGGIWRSTDRGETWQQCLYTYDDFYCLASCESLIVAGGYGVYTSSDDGAHWVEPDPTFKTRLTSLGVLPRNDTLGRPSLLFAASGELDVYRSRDMAQSWELVGPGVGRTLASDDTLLYAGRFNGIRLSTDAGTTWSALDSSQTLQYTYGLLARRDRQLWAGSIDGVLRSGDRGIHWEVADSGLTGHKLLSLAVKDSFLFAGTVMGPLRSTDHGRSWSRVDFTLTPLSQYYSQDGWVDAIAVQDSTVLAGRGGAMLRSSDLGEHWEVSTTYAAWIEAIVCTDSSWHVGGRITSRSIDDGLTWVHTLPEFVRCIADGSQGMLYLTTFAPATVHLSTDDGLSWRAMGTGARAPWALVARGSELFGGYSDGGVFHSTDQGLTWMPANKGLPPAQGYPWGAITLALTRSGGTFFAGNSQGSVYRWEGDSLGWMPINEGLTGYGVRALTIDGNYLYAGMLNGSIWYRPLSEITGVGEELHQALPERFRLEQCFPNPFNPVTQINYTVGQGEGERGRGGDGGWSVQVQLIVYDILGRKVATLVNEPQRPGSYSVKFDGANLASGIYLYRLQAGAYVLTRKMLLLK